MEVIEIHGTVGIFVFCTLAIAVIVNIFCEMSYLLFSYKFFPNLNLLLLYFYCIFISINFMCDQFVIHVTVSGKIIL